MIWVHRGPLWGVGGFLWGDVRLGGGSYGAEGAMGQWGNSMGGDLWEMGRLWGGGRGGLWGDGESYGVRGDQWGDGGPYGAEGTMG